MSQIVTGFNSPVHDAQQVFRALMDAMSRPGKCVTLQYDAQFGGASTAATQVLLTLADHATPLWLSPAFQVDDALIENLRFHCAVPMTRNKQEATFALASGQELESLTGFAEGDESYPDRSTTLILEVESVSEGDELQLSGPGIQTTTTLCIKGLNPSLLNSILEGRNGFPNGIDIVFTAESQLVALPRSTSVTLTNALYDKEAACM